jgi:hypothetical protein
MCIDYTDLNKHCPKDPFPLPRIDQVVDSMAGSILLCFLDCYSGYHQIALHPEDEDKMTFITPHGIYCYKVMTFGLKNARATYQKAIQKCLASQIWKNIEAYVDDVVVKTTEEDKLIADLAETFSNLREFQWKLNPTKCVFSVPSGLLLGFMVGHRGIEANPAKVDAIRKMAKPSNKKDVMKLTRMMVALGCFISKLGKKGLPFFKLLKKADKFVWDDEAQKAFEVLKESLMTPPIMTPPIPKETLLLYISATTNVVSTVLVTEREEEGQAYPVQRPMYYMREVLADSKTRLSVRKVVPTLTSKSAEIYPSTAGAKQLGDTRFILVPSEAVRPTVVCSGHYIALHHGACRGMLQVRRERRLVLQVPEVLIEASANIVVKAGGVCVIAIHPPRLGDCPSFHRPRRGQFTGVPLCSPTCEGMASSATELTTILANLAPVEASWRVLCLCRSDFEGSGVEVGCPAAARGPARGWCQWEIVRGTVAVVATSCPCALQQCRDVVTVPGVVLQWRGWPHRADGNGEDRSR